MDNRYYTLDGKIPKPLNTVDEWANAFEGLDRTVAKTDVGEDALVSTVFLGLNHAYGDGEPELFETMIFGGKEDGYQERYATWKQAEQGHKKAVEIANKAI